MSAATDFESCVNDDKWAIWSAHLRTVISDGPADLQHELGPLWIDFKVPGKSLQ